MVFDSLAGVVRTGAGAEDERPVAGLSQQELARGLLERPRGQAGCRRKLSRQSAHPRLRHIQMGINPLVVFIEPHTPVSFLTPTRRAGRCDLLGRVLAQIFLGRDQGEDFLVMIRLAHKEIEPLDAFVPPVAEKFRVVRAENQRGPIHDARQALDLLQTRAEEMAGVFVRRA